MPFARLHEEAAGDSKLLALSNAAWRMWGMGIIYCQKNLTDGFIPAAAVHSWGIRGGRLGQVAEELCTPQVPGKRPLWEKAEGGYQIHDYLQWNDTKEEILRGRAEGRDRVARWRARQKADQERGSNPITSRASDAVRNVLQEPYYVVRGESTQKGGSGGKPPDLPISARSKRPIFSGQSIRVFEWQLDDLERMLGKHFEGFRLDEFFQLLDERAFASGQVIPQRDGGQWLQAQVMAEAQRRGLTIADSTAPKAGPRSSVPSAEATRRLLQLQAEESE